MNKIFKYELELKDEQTLQVPKYSRVLTCQVQNGKLCLWVLVDNSKPVSEVHVNIVGTGNPVSFPVGEFGFSYVSTIQFGSFVWHVFASGIKL